MQLSNKPRTFCFNFIAFLESILNFEQKDRPIAYSLLSISEIIDSEIRGNLNT